MNKALIIIAFFLYASIGRAQESEPENGSKKHFIYFNPGALINVPSGFQVGYDLSIFKNTHFDIQGGVLLFSKNPTYNDFSATKKRGMRFQAGLKNYLKSDVYIGPKVLYKRVTMNDNMWFLRFDSAFQQRLEVRRIRSTVAVAVDIGWDYTFKRNPLLMEISYGIGVQNVKVRYEDVPDDVNFEMFRGIGIVPGSFYYPFFNFNVKLKYPLVAISKKRMNQSGQEKKSRMKKSRRG